MNIFLYVMISSTSTHVGKAIQRVTGYPYNHVSISVDPELRNWISFARIQKDTPLVGGLIEENSGRYRTMGDNMPVRIFRIPITEKEYTSLSDFFSAVLSDRKHLTYNSFGALANAFHSENSIIGAYTCLDFANYVLGYRFSSIQELNRDLQEFQFYEGDYFELIHADDAPTEKFMEKCILLVRVAKTARHFRKLTLRKLRPNRYSDPIREFPGFSGIDLISKRSRL